MTCPDPECLAETEHVHFAVWNAEQQAWDVPPFHPPRHQGYVVDQRYLQLLVQARVWRASLIPKTSTASQGPTSQLLRAIEDLD